jgi:hypothetical protein
MCVDDAINISSLSKSKMAGFSNSKWPMGEKKYSVHNSVELACVYVRCWLPARPCSSSIPILIAHENTRTHTHTPGGKWPPQAKKKNKKKDVNGTKIFIRVKLKQTFNQVIQSKIEKKNLSS